MTDKFTILFYLWNNRLNRHGKAPIMVRISYRGKRKQFSSGHSIEPHRWTSGESSIPELDADNDYIHFNLLLLQDKLNRTYLQLQLEGHDFSVEDIYTKFQRKDIQEDYSLLRLFEQYNQRTKKLVGIEIKQVTYEKFVQAANHLRQFIPFKYGKKVKIISYKAVQNKEGKEFFALTLMGGIEAVKSSNGNYYLTAKKASIPSTFSEEICIGLIGQSLEGEIVKIPCEPYSFTSKSTGEEITLKYRYGYQESKALPVQNSLDKEVNFLPANTISSNIAYA